MSLWAGIEVWKACARRSASLSAFRSGCVIRQVDFNPDNADSQPTWTSALGAESNLFNLAPALHPVTNTAFTKATNKPAGYTKWTSFVLKSRPFFLSARLQHCACLLPAVKVLVVRVALVMGSPHSNSAVTKTVFPKFAFFSEILSIYSEIISCCFH